MNIGVAGKNRSIPQPLPRVGHQSGTYWIVEDVKAGGSERTAFSFLPAQDGVMRLLLQFVRRCSGRISPGELDLKILSQKAHGIDLVRGEIQPHPDQVQVVRHQDINWTEERLARGGVQQQPAELSVKGPVQPADS